jgi:O6-methylguanine-DNA--protein-cysteine methyltransferase
MGLTREAMIERMLGSDKTANGQFIVGVRTTKIYCLPACRPPRKPKPGNVTFYETIDEARAGGLRACKLCKPDEFYVALGQGGAAMQQERLAYVDTITEAPGPLAFAVNADGAMLWVKFLDGEYTRSLEEELAHEGYMVAQDPECTAQAREQLTAYCAGQRQTFDLPLIFSGSPWQKLVWQALTQIPIGKRAPTAKSRRSSTSPARRGQWDAPTRPIACRSSFPVTASSARMAR